MGDDNWRLASGRKDFRKFDSQSNGHSRPNSKHTYNKADNSTNWRRAPHKDSNSNSSFRHQYKNGPTKPSFNQISLADAKTICGKDEPLGRFLIKLLEQKDGQYSSVKSVRMTWNSTMREVIENAICSYTTIPYVANLKPGNKSLDSDSSDEPNLPVIQIPLRKNKGLSPLPDNIDRIWPAVLIEIASFSPGNDHLFATSMQLIAGIQERHRLSICNQDLWRALADLILRSIDTAQAWVKPFMLQALAALILGNINQAQSMFHRLAEKFLVEASWERNPQNSLMVLHAVTGLANLSYFESETDTMNEEAFDSGDEAMPNEREHKPRPRRNLDALEEKKGALLMRFLNAFVALMDDVPGELNVSIKYRIQHMCLHGITMLLARSPRLCLDVVGRLLTLLRPLLGCGLVKYPANLGPVITLGGGAGSSMGPADLASLNSTKIPVTGAKQSKIQVKDTRPRPNSDCLVSLEERLSQINLSEHDLSNLMTGDIERTTSQAADNNSVDDLFSSDYSDSEVAATGTTVSTDPSSSHPIKGFSEKKCQDKTRRLSLTALHTLLGIVQKRVLTACWPAFLPDGSGVNRPTLLTLIMKERDYRLRHFMLEIVRSLILSGRDYLSAAEDIMMPNTAFTPHSVRLATALRELHRRLLLALVAEKSTSVKVLLLRCLANLISNVPYHKLKPGLLTQIVRVIQPFMEVNNSIDVRTCVLCVWSAIVSLDGPLLEVCHLITTPPQAIKLSDSSNQSPTLSVNCSGLQTPFLPEFQPELSHMSGSCWLVQFCLDLIEPDSEFGWSDCPTEAASNDNQKRAPTFLRVQALNTLKDMKEFYMRYLKNSMARLKKAVNKCLNSREKDHVVIRTGALKVLKEIISALLTSPHSEDKETVVQIWKEFIDPLTACLQSGEELFGVCSRACYCLSLLDDRSFREALTPSQSFVCLSTVISLCSDEFRHVRGNAVKTLGFWVTLNSVNSDSGVFSDIVYESERLSRDKDVAFVRIHAAWSLANCAEILVARKEGSLKSAEDNVDMNLLLDEEASLAEDSVLREFGRTPHRLLNMFDVCRFLCAGVTPTSSTSSRNYSSRFSSFLGGPGVAKLCENGARALGYLFRFVPAKLAHDPDMKKEFELSAKTLCDAMVVQDVNGAAKIRWNACFAIGNIFCNRHLPIGREWTVPIIQHLCNALLTDKYFKARIYTALSLISLTEANCREFLGSETFYLEIVESVLSAGCQIHQRTDVAFTEMHHKHYCLYLIKLLLIKLISLLSIADVTPSLDQLVGKYQVFLEEVLPLVWQERSTVESQQSLHVSKEYIISRTALVDNRWAACNCDLGVELNHLDERLQILQSDRSIEGNDFAARLLVKLQTIFQGVQSASIQEQELGDFYEYSAQSKMSGFVQTYD